MTPVFDLCSRYVDRLAGLDPVFATIRGWPAQAISYKVDERAWLAARAQAQAQRRPGFDLKRWHTAALDLGPVGLDHLTAALRGVS